MHVGGNPVFTARGEKETAREKNNSDKLTLRKWPIF